MRLVAGILVATGIYLLGCAAFDEWRGSTHQPFYFIGRHRYNSAYLYRLSVAKANNPELFRKFMGRHWVYAAAFSVGGVILILAAKNQEDREK